MRPLNPLRQAILLITLSLCLTSCQPQRKPNVLQQVTDSGVLKVGTQYGLTTYYTGPNGPEGFEYELVKGFADYLGVRLEVYPYFSLSQAFSQVQKQQIQLLAAGLSVTPQRSADFKFGPPYQYVSQKLIFKQGEVRPRGPEDLTGEMIVVAGSNHTDTLKGLQQKLPALDWQETNEMDNEELMEAVLREEYDYTVADSNILAIMRRRHPELSIGFTLQEPQRVAWAMSKEQDDSLLAAMLDYFGSLYEDGRLAALEDKYFGHIRQFNYVDTRLFIKAAEQTLPKYQPLFEQYADKIDWRLVAAMSYQESHWNPRARSPTGVRGMMMLTLPTAKDLGVTSRLDPRQSIQGGATYLQGLVERIPERIEYPDRLWFALAAYNVGMGHLEDARILTERQGGNPDIWVDVKSRLPLLRQKRFYKTTRYGYARGDEAVTYVANIRRYYDTLVWLDEQQRLNADNDKDETIGE
ncbi:membrane-bound lytic murein transglycosylase MltF [Lacimicrobium alkaliphilum]|uniref:membrane-bound lytic murein transglycosylase MltF n=1 Tax=Lacimicrobium alkaliphilum TaxID=1526571 RepID=UPI000AEDC48E|nr:membrane-bound lytic murein transglycosylase MltF [Lacimicrobium alkaliphilum]